MPGHHVITKRCDGWVIAVDGAMLLVCERKKVAIRAVREAIARSGAQAGEPDASCHVESQTETLDGINRVMTAAR